MLNVCCNVCTSTNGPPYPADSCSALSSLSYAPGMKGVLGIGCWKSRRVDDRFCLKEVGGRGHGTGMNSLVLMLLFFSFFRDLAQDVRSPRKEI
jgi:hypothetical protein